MVGLVHETSSTQEDTKQSSAAWSNTNWSQLASLLSPLDDLHVSSNSLANKLSITVSKVYTYECLNTYECTTGLRSQAGNVNTIVL